MIDLDQALAFARELYAAWPTVTATPLTLEIVAGELKMLDSPFAANVVAEAQDYPRPPSLVEVRALIREIRSRAERAAGVARADGHDFGDGLACRHGHCRSSALVHGHLLEDSSKHIAHGMFHLRQRWDGDASEETLLAARWPERCGCEGFPAWFETRRRRGEKTDDLNSLVVEGERQNA